MRFAAIRKEKIVELAGQTFGRWIVIEYSHDTVNNIYWTCRCECGTVRRVCSNSLRYGASRSCGCLQKELAGKRSTTHGHSRAPIYTAWRNMVRRCHDPRSDEYQRYGARGVIVCDRWRESFQSFLEDVGERPSPEMTIDRYPDPFGNYEPGNTRWATPMEQGQNRRNNRKLTLNGVTQSFAAWSRELGIAYTTIRNRADSGWSDQEILTTPTTLKKPHSATSSRKVKK